MDRRTTDASADETSALLASLRTATQRLLADVNPLDGADLDQPSLMPGWSRRTVVAHLIHGARTTARMLDDAPSQEVAFYPGGARERERSLVAAQGFPAAEVADRLADACEHLEHVTRGVPASVWERTVREPRLGTMALSRLVLLRLTEVEVHHSDLGTGYLPQRWSNTLVDIGLPLRISWLGPHHRNREGADLTVSGSWQLVRTDRPGAWRVDARGAEVRVTDQVHPDGRDANVVLTGEGWRLLAFLLGRDDLGRTEAAARFKRAFPGP